jgi:predicted outer membrane protein
VLTALKKAWVFVKTYWKYIVLVFLVIALVIFGARQKIDLAAKLREIQDAHDEELKQIEAARIEERRKNEENVKRLQAALEAVQQKYDEQRKQLDAKKKTEVETIVKKYGDNPEELAKKLSEVTGFQIILP